MKTFSEYIREDFNFRLGGSTNKGVQYSYFPKDGDELKKLMKKLRQEIGEDGDFSDIDTSNVTDMSNLFFYEKQFNGDISLWDTSKVTSMYIMFFNAKNFNQDISRWDVSKVTDTRNMFNGCPIKEEYKPKFSV